MLSEDTTDTIEEMRRFYDGGVERGGNSHAMRLLRCVEALLADREELVKENADLRERLHNPSQYANKETDHA